MTTHQPGDQFENPFLSVEKKIVSALNEGDAELQVANPTEKTEQPGNIDEAQLYESFVKEKAALLSYVHDLVRYAAKSCQIDISAILTEEVKEDRIKEERDVLIINYRVSSIVSSIYSLTPTVLA